MGQGFVRRGQVVVLLAAMLLLAACETRSISNSGYGGYGNAFYRGELSEFDLLGVDPRRPASDDEIARQLDTHQKLALHKGDTLLVIQSGAAIPDDAMAKALGRSFSVVPFSGVPPAQSPGQPEDYARALRLVAAKAGADAILCYWGVLESAVEGEPTKVVSWIPVIGQAVPDQAQLMRIRLELAVIDVRTGQWSMLAPEPFVDSSLSASLTRAASDQRQVETLKQKAYGAAVDALITRYAS
jgi:hypothetical protein